jgi:putative lysine transport system substrate-binding protein
LLLAFSTVLTGCGGDKKEGKESSNEFRVGLECAYAPFNWTQTDDSNGALPIKGGGYAGGYDVEIAKEIAKGLGKKLVIVKTEWNGLLPALTSGKIDAIIAGMSPTAKRKKSIDFSDNYYKSELVVVVKKDGKYASAKNIKDFAGAKITAQVNTFHYSVIDQMPKVEKQTEMEDFPTMIVALNSGKIDGYISEEPGAVAAVAANSNLAFISFNAANGFKTSDDDVAIAVGLKKNSNLTKKINDVLAGISQADRDEIMQSAFDNQPTVE